MSPQQEEQKVQVMAFIMELENKVRDKNSQIEKLKKDVDQFQKLYVQAAFLQPWGASITGAVIGLVVGAGGMYLLFRLMGGMCL